MISNLNAEGEDSELIWREKMTREMIPNRDGYDDDE